MASTGVAQPQSFPRQETITIVVQVNNQEDMDYISNKAQDEDIIVDLKEFAEMAMLTLISVNGEAIK